MDWEKIGEITHYFSKIGVAVVRLENNLATGDWVAFVRGEELLFEQEVVSMQIDYREVEAATAGQIVALQTAQKVKVGAEVYKAVG